MTWREISDLKDLSQCPNCNSKDLIQEEYFNKIHTKCNCCGCDMYQALGRLWYKVPDKQKDKPLNIEGYYECDRE